MPAAAINTELQDDLVDKHGSGGVDRAGDLARPAARYAKTGRHPCGTCSLPSAAGWQYNAFWQPRCPATWQPVGNLFAIFTDEPVLISLDPRPAFEGFDHWTLAPQPVWPAAGIALGGERRATRKLLRREAPLTPGVYGMIDAQGELIYVGQSKSLRNRLLSYFTGSAPSKAHRIVARAQQLHWETAPDEFAALLRELELIRRWRPRLNVRGQPNRRRPGYLILGRGPVPYAYLAAAPTRGDTAIFGPVRVKRDCRHAIHVLSDLFQLRVCGQQVPMRLADQRQMFPAETDARCMRRDLGICLAPCAAGCSAAEYRDRVRAAKRFLSGCDLSVLTRLERSMAAAAAAQRYEEAAVLRDQREALQNLQDQLQRLRRARRRYNFIYPAPGQHGRSLWYFIRRGQVQLVREAPQSREDCAQCLAALKRIYATGSVPLDQATREDAEMTLLVTGWFRSRPDELRRTLSPEAVASRCCGS
jgi:excinuclease ABC subunit C